MTTETQGWAPDFGRKEGEPFPSRGKKLGPAWMYAWAALSDGGVISRKDLAYLMAQDTDITFKTAENLLAYATKAGLLRVHSRGTHGVPFLVRTDRYYAQFPEEAPEGYEPPRPPEEGS